MEGLENQVKHRKRDGRGKPLPAPKELQTLPDRQYNTACRDRQEGELNMTYNYLEAVKSDVLRTRFRSFAVRKTPLNAARNGAM